MVSYKNLHKATRKSYRDFKAIFYIDNFYTFVVTFDESYKILQKNGRSISLFLKNFHIQKKVILQFFSTSAKIPNAVFPMLRVMYFFLISF